MCFPILDKEDEGIFGRSRLVSGSQGAVLVWVRTTGFLDPFTNDNLNSRLFPGLVSILSGRPRWVVSAGEDYRGSVFGSRFHGWWEKGKGGMRTQSEPRSRNGDFLGDGVFPCVGRVKCGLFRCSSGSLEISLRSGTPVTGRGSTLLFPVPFFRL